MMMMMMNMYNITDLNDLYHVPRYVENCGHRHSTSRGQNVLFPYVIVVIPSLQRLGFVDLGTTSHALESPRLPLLPRSVTLTRLNYCLIRPELLFSNRS